MWGERAAVVGGAESGDTARIAGGGGSVERYARLCEPALNVGRGRGRAAGDRFRPEMLSHPPAPLARMAAALSARLRYTGGHERQADDLCRQRR